MPIPAGVILGAGALGGLFQGLSGASAASKGVKEQAREFNISGAPGVSRLQQSAPLRDRLLQIASARFGANPTTYTQAQGQYQPSSDLAHQEELYKKLLAQMGYGAQAGYTPPPAPMQQGPGAMLKWAGDRAHENRGY